MANKNCQQNNLKKLHVWKRTISINTSIFINKLIYFYLVIVFRHIIGGGGGWKGRKAGELWLTGGRKEVYFHE